ncbi:23S rRNA (guanosine(2251)-2'-O)-methyltransferase RlmB [uncultured Parolsenella sp.]|uniref:23S rRNA (guanosine(2251)-2'-O)-methyltransferase RlmB n=1 Tax=uncultured Parolsenella sp. TaxID=2083008 RepID=UPI0025F6284D|nr:23S rRNA (guanosine(2251)-2'-O)-methyltransferase RlmB [uncultured Parolsenella sp.]
MARRNDSRPSGRRDARGAASRGRQGGQQRGGSQQRGGKPRQQASGARTGTHTGVPARTRGPQGQRAGSKGDLIEGRRAAAEALELGLPITRALIQKDSGAVDPTLTDLARRLEANGVEVERVARPVLDSLSSHGAHQGIMLKVRPYRYASLHDIIEAAGSGSALVIVLDHVTDEGNFGAIVRTAEVVGAAGVVVAKSRAARVGVGAYKTSAGAVMHLPIAQVPNLASALDELKEHGFWAGGATEHASDLVWDAPVAGRLALVMGSEGSGISRLVRQHCDFEFKLPQRGQVESLNVAQATTAIAYEWLRRDMAAGEGAQAVSEPAGDGYDAPLDLPDTSDFDFPETDLD